MTTKSQHAVSLEHTPDDLCGEIDALLDVVASGQYVARHESRQAKQIEEILRGYLEPSGEVRKRADREGKIPAPPQTSLGRPGSK